MGQKSAADCIAGARQMLDHARTGQRDYLAAGERRLSGLYAAVTSARSVTFALQNMNGHVDGADAWYESVRARLRADAVARFFVDLRNRIEKQGTHGHARARLNITYANGAEMMREAPPGATGFILGDPLGRSGWEVKLPDGSKQIVYFTLPPDVGTSTLHLAEAPEGRDIADLLDEYLRLLEDILTEAETTFLT